VELAKEFEDILLTLPMSKWLFRSLKREKATKKVQNFFLSENRIGAPKISR
jgi:hypothetical protein